MTEVCLNEEVLSVSVHRSSRPTPREAHYFAGVWQELQVDSSGVGIGFTHPGPFTICLGGVELPEHFQWVSWITARAIQAVGVNASVAVRLNSVTLR
jgi:hypothetical protein